MGKSRLHEQLAEFLGHLVMAVAAYLAIDCEPSGEATFRRRKKAAGLEGDRTFHFGANAERMRGLRNYDFDVDPPPDLAIEVEASHPADDAIAAWGRLGVPEVWRFDAATSTCTFWNRRDGESYEQVGRSMFLPMLELVRRGRPASPCRRTGIVEMVPSTRRLGPRRDSATARSRRRRLMCRARTKRRSFHKGIFHERQPFQHLSQDP